MHGFVENNQGFLRLGVKNRILDKFHRLAVFFLPSDAYRFAIKKELALYLLLTFLSKKHK